MASIKMLGKRKRNLDAGQVIPEKVQEIANMEQDSQPSKKVAFPSTPELYAKGLARNTDKCLLPWPQLFTDLERTHKALNLVCTFCCTRKHLITTFDAIKPAVESHTKKPLLLEDVALLASLRPESIKLCYMDESMLRLDIMGAEQDVFKSTNSPKSKGLQEAADVESTAGHTSIVEYHDRDIAQIGKGVLYFEFLDGDLKRQVLDKKTGQATRATRKLGEEDLKMPVYSQTQMMQLIERRNHRFTNSINNFLTKCAEAELDPCTTLKAQAEAFIPKAYETEEDTVPLSINCIPKDIPKIRKSIPEIIQDLRRSSWYTGQIVPDGHRVFEPQEPTFGELNFLLSQDLVNALYNAKGIFQFYAHQAEALNGLYEGQDIMVATSTSSGKSLIYQLPVLRSLETDRNSRALYIFPTKALAQDQKRSLKELLAYLPSLESTMVETFDGDTPMNARNLIREEANVIFTNPDMLHLTILPQEERWRSFMKHLRFVVGMESISRLKGSKLTLIIS